jgi:hypothetical protein
LSLLQVKAQPFSRINPERKAKMFGGGVVSKVAQFQFQIIE